MIIFRSACGVPTACIWRSRWKEVWTEEQGKKRHRDVFFREIGDFCQRHYWEKKEKADDGSAPAGGQACLWQTRTEPWCSLLSNSEFSCSRERSGLLAQSSRIRPTGNLVLSECTVCIHSRNGNLARACVFHGLFTYSYLYIWIWYWIMRTLSSCEQQREQTAKPIIYHIIYGDDDDDDSLTIICLHYIE